MNNHYYARNVKIKNLKPLVTLIISKQKALKKENNCDIFSMLVSRTQRRRRRRRKKHEKQRQSMVTEHTSPILTILPLPISNTVPLAGISLIDILGGTELGANNEMPARGTVLEIGKGRIVKIGEVCSITMLCPCFSCFLFLLFL